MDENLMNTNTDQEEWLRNRVRAASIMSPSGDFSEKVMLEVHHEAQMAKASAPPRKPLAQSTKLFLRRGATILLWSGIVVFVVGLVLSASLLPLNSLSHASVERDSPTFMAVGFILVFLVGLAVWEWIDQYI